MVKCHQGSSYGLALACGNAACWIPRSVGPGKPIINGCKKFQGFTATLSSGRSYSVQQRHIKLISNKNPYVLVGSTGIDFVRIVFQ